MLFRSSLHLNLILISQDLRVFAAWLTWIKTGVPKVVSNHLSQNFTYFSNYLQEGMKLILRKTDKHRLSLSMKNTTRHPFLDGKVTLLAGLTFLHLYTLARLTENQF